MDAGSYKWLHRFVNKAYLPTFKFLMQKSVWGELTSSIPPTTPIAWTTILTGVGPSSHGLFNFYDLNNGNHVNIYESRYPLLWEELQTLGIAGAYLWIPMTYPATNIHDGIMISGFPFPDDPSKEKKRKGIHPLTLYKDLSPYEVDFLFENRYSYNDLIRKINIRFNIIEHLLDNRDLHLLFAVVQETDHVWHSYNKEEYGIRIYEEVDKRLKRLLKVLNSSFDEYNLFIISDHGASDIAYKGVFLNNLLRRKGHLRLKEIKGQNSYRYNFLKKIGDLLYTDTIENLFSVVVRFASFNLLARLTILSQYRENLGTRKNVSSIDMKCSDAYVAHGATSRYAGIKIRPQVTKEVEAILKQLSENGNSIIKNIHQAKEIYGRHTDEGYDLVLELNDGYAAFDAIMPINHICKIQKYYIHSTDGIFIGHSKFLKENLHMAEMKLVQVAPILFYCAGLPIPSHFEGNMRSDIVSHKLKTNKIHILNKCMLKRRIRKIVSFPSKR